MWDRSLQDSWVDWFKEDYQNNYLVHGHTPVQLLNFDKVYYYAKGHKINIDMGAFASNKTILFNLDTLEPEIYFYVKGSVNNGRRS